MICSFYSYTGGAGVTSAVANIAEILSRQGLKILMIDFDLPKPGLEYFFNVDSSVNNLSDIQSQRGLIDMLVSYKDFFLFPKLPGYEDRGAYEPIQNFFCEIYSDKLFLMTAGSDNYFDKILSFDWNDFYDNYQGEFFFKWFKNELNQHFDVVLVNAPSGITPINGTVLYELSDSVIFFILPNKISFEKNYTIAKSLSNKDFIDNAKNGKTVATFFVPCHVNDGEFNLMNKFMIDFQEKFNFFLESKIEHIPYYNYNFNVASRDFLEKTVTVVSFGLYKSYSKLSEIILNFNKKYLFFKIKN